MSAAIRRVATLHGKADHYHETITRSWLQLLAVHRIGSTATSFDEFIADNEALLDGRLLSRHYSDELLQSEGARGKWTAPDLHPLPVVG